MANQVSMLFLPPMAPVPLEPGCEVTLGRSPECGMTLASDQASRRHALVRRVGDKVVVEDLGSTNGTSVNDEPINAERELRPGDQIQIGELRVTYCLMDADQPPPAAPTDPGATVIAAPTPGPQILAGDLAQIPLFAVLQMLEMGDKSGRLSVETGQGPMSIWLAGNRMVHAETEKQKGMDAALEIASVQQGKFEFAANEEPPERSFEAGVTEIILESSRLEDEREFDPDADFDLLG